MTAALVTDDWMAEYRGLVIGAPDSPFSLAAVDGLLGTPGVRVSDRSALRRHGEIPGSDWLGARVVGLTIEVYGRDESEFRAAMETVSAAFAPAGPDAPFTFRFPGVAGGGLRFVTARVRNWTAPVDIEFANSLAMVAVQLYCFNPRILDATPLSAAVALPNPDAPGGGILVPFTLPFTFGPSPNLGLLTVNNSGTFEVRPKFRIRGPVADPQIVNLDTGGQITFKTVLLVGEWLDIDCDTHEVLLNGSAPRFLTSGTANVWPTCPPGVTRLAFRGFRLDPGPPGDGAELTCEWRSAWV